MLKRTGDTVQLRNVAMDDDGASTSYSSSTSSSDSESGVVGGGGRRFIHPHRCPGLQRLSSREVVQLGEMRNRDAHTSAHQGDAHAVAGSPFRSQETPQPARAVQERGISSVALHSANCQSGSWTKAIFVSLVVLCATLACLSLMHWIRARRREVYRVSARRSVVDHASLPVFSDCDKWTCKKYVAAIELSINRSQDPCTNFYRFVCDGWKQHHRLLSVINVVEDAMYDRAMSAMETVSLNISNHNIAASSNLGVRKRIAALVSSCLKYSESSLTSLKWFMAQHYLPWPETSHRDLLDIFLDLSGNYNFHLWFRISLDLSRHRSKTGKPLLKLGPSPTFRVWIALMRTFGSQPRGTTLSLHYQRYVLKMLRLFGAPESRLDELLATILSMNRLTLAVLGPAMADPEQRTSWMSVRNFTDTMTPGISTSRWVLLLNQYFIWAGKISAETMVQVENPDLFRALVYLLGLDTEMRQAMTLSLGLRLVGEIGWMADREIANSTLELMGLPASAHIRRCLVQVESSVGVAWLSLFPGSRKAEALVKDIQDSLVDVVMRYTRTSFSLRARGDPALLDDESLFANALPETTFGPSFFTSWMDLMNSRWQLREPSSSNVLKPGSAVSQQWSLHSPLTTSDEYFLFPLFHSDLPLAANYGGAGRLIADEVLRGLFFELLASDRQQLRRSYYNTDPNEGGTTYQPQPDVYPHMVDSKALLAAWKAYRLGFLRHFASPRARKPTVEEDRLFFVAACYALCSSDDYMGELYGDGSRRCNKPVTAMPEFRLAFQCDAL